MVGTSGHMYTWYETVGRGWAPTRPLFPYNTFANINKCNMGFVTRINGRPNG